MYNFQGKLSNDSYQIFHARNFSSHNVYSSEIEHSLKFIKLREKLIAIKGKFQKHNVELERDLIKLQTYYLIAYLNFNVYQKSEIRINILKKIRSDENYWL